MATIVILEHELQRGAGLPYMVYALAERWRAAGHGVILHRGLDNPPAADIAIVNIDLTVIPAAYRALCARYERVVNGRVADVSKTTFSQDIVDRYSDWIGPVIVKTDANFGGKPERFLRSLARGAGPQDDIPAGPVLEHYPIYASLRQVPDGVWRTAGLIVERFLPEKDARGYYSRHWLFFGDRDRSIRIRANVPIIKSHDMLERVEAPVPDEIRAWRAKLGFDYGKFDFVRYAERWVLLDVNRTPSLPARGGAEAEAGIDTLAAGLESLLR